MKLTRLKFRIPSDFTNDEFEDVVGELEDWGADLITRNPLVVEVERDLDGYRVEDVIGVGLDYGLEVVSETTFNGI